MCVCVLVCVCLCACEDPLNLHRHPVCTEATWPVCVCAWVLVDAACCMNPAALAGEVALVRLRVPGTRREERGRAGGGAVGEVGKRV